MKKTERLLKSLGDTTRLRILMLLTNKELCVCQIMGVLGISQPLVSRNLRLLGEAGFLEERKEGKLVFYSIKKEMENVNIGLVDLLKETLEGERVISEDLRSLKNCEEFQKKTGKCDMKTFYEYMAKHRKNAGKT